MAQKQRYKDPYHTSNVVCAVVMSHANEVQAEEKQFCFSHACVPALQGYFCNNKIRMLTTTPSKRLPLHNVQTFESATFIKFFLLYFVHFQ